MTDVEQADGTKQKRVKHPIPDGFYTPTELMQHLGFAGTNSDPTAEAPEDAQIQVDAQNVYAWVRGSETNGFPHVTHTDLRTIIPRDQALAWVNEHMDEVKARKAKRRANAANREERLIKNLVTAARAFAVAASD